MITYVSKVLKPITFSWLDIGNQFEYEGRPYIKIEYKSSYNSYAFSYTSGKIFIFHQNNRYIKQISILRLNKGNNE